MIDKIFKKSSEDNRCNTSYPLNKESWLDYKVYNHDLFFGEEELSIYIHISFCETLCSFCEYIKFKTNEEYEKQYIKILIKDIESFLKTHSIKKLYGFDVGGGTPTSLNIESFKELMKISKKINSLSRVSDYESSIEGTFNTITEEKIKLIKNSGFSRISLGIQTTNTKVLFDNNRPSIKLEKMIEVVNLIKKYGMKVNIDLMYGISGQTINDVKNSIEVIKSLSPNHVTLYEMRYNMINKKCNFDKESLYNFYEKFYLGLTKLGYKSNFSQNTFTKEDDLGLSSYLKYRMIENISYKGFGISAQSKSKTGLSYNVGKSKLSFEECTKRKTFYEEDIYLLPKEELLAKYIAVSLYYGKFKLSIMESIIEDNPTLKYKKEFEYLLSNNYVSIDGDWVSLTKKGFKYFGSVGSLFYSNKTKKMLLGGSYDKTN